MRATGHPRIDDLIWNINYYRDQLKQLERYMKEAAREYRAKKREFAPHIGKAEKELASLLKQAKEGKIRPCRRHTGNYESNSPEGLGYSGKICTRCNSLVIRDRKVFKTIKPTHPFKPGCKHPKSKVLEWFDFKRMFPGRQDLAPLNVNGRYCTVCGKCWSVEER